MTPKSPFTVAVYVDTVTVRHPYTNEEVGIKVFLDTQANALFGIDSIHLDADPDAVTHSPYIEGSIYIGEDL